jgi:hypothetical protein
MRAQALVEVTLSESIAVERQEGEMAPLVDEEVQHCAAVIAAAFLNPSKPY